MNLQKYFYLIYSGFQYVIDTESDDFFPADIPIVGDIITSIGDKVENAIETAQSLVPGAATTTP